MNRREFINLLTDSLAGRVPNRLISEKADYYRQYISEHARDTGRTEEDIIEELGPPELIAHTIIDVYEAEHGVYEGGADDAAYQDVKSRMNTDEDSADAGRKGFFSLNLGGNGCLLIFVLVIFLFLAIGIWMVRFIAAYPLLVLIAAVVIYLWTHYKNRG